MTADRSHVVVVGAGLAGLSAACHLRSRGYAVTVVEAGDLPGGRAGSERIDGYRFDTGPTVLTLPHLVDDCIHVLGLDPGSYWSARPLDPMYRACFADGSTIRVRQGREAMADEITRECGPAEAAAFVRFCDWLRELFELEMPTFIDRNYDSPMSILSNPAALARLARMGGHRRLDAVVRRFFTDDRLVRLFSFQAMYAGLAPDRALAVYAVITYMDAVSGVYVADGGMHAVPSALAAAAGDAGVEFLYQTVVDQIVLDHGSHGRVRTVRTADQQSIAADAVVCTADLPVAYRTMLRTLRPPRRWRRSHYSPSALVWHAGVQGPLPPDVEHHNIHFGRSWESSFRAIFDEGRPMPDPSMLITVPTVSEPTMAPPGRHVLFALEPVANLDGRTDWNVEREAARQRLIARVESFGYPIDCDAEWFVDPLDWEAAGLERGTPFALSHRFLQSGPFRPSNTHADAPGLVFAGSGTVPGVGVPMVLLSGRLAADRVDEAIG